MSKLQRSYNLLNPNQAHFFQEYVILKSKYNHIDTNYINPIFKLLSNNQLTSNNIHQAACRIFEGENPEQILRRRMTQIFQHWRHFVAFELTASTEGNLEEGIAKFLKQNKHQDQALLILENQAGQVEKSNTLSAYEHLTLLMNKTIQHEILSQNQRRKDLKIQESLEHLDQYTSYLYLKWACMALSHKRLSGQDYKLAHLPYVIRQVDATPDKLLNLESKSYRLVYTLLTEGCHNTFLSLTENLNSLSKMSAEDRKNIILFAINFCIKQANSGQKSYIKEAFKLYKMGLDQDIFLNNDILSKYTFRNIINHGFALNELEWVENFMQQYKSKLESETRENTFQYNMARLHFQKKNYDEVMSILSTIIFDDVNYNIDARRMMTKIYLLKNEINVLYYHLDSFKIYLIRHKKQFVLYRPFSTFIKFSKKVINLTILTKEQRKILLNKMKNAQPFIDQKWLIDYVEGITLP